jgi:hypothetical protein
VCDVRLLLVVEKVDEVGRVIAGVRGVVSVVDVFDVEAGAVEISGNVFVGSVFEGGGGGGVVEGRGDVERGAGGLVRSQSKIPSQTVPSLVVNRAGLYLA